MEKTFTVQNPTGIHARPAKKIVTTANGFPCSVYLVKNEKKSSAKSLVGVLSVGAKHGDDITVIAEGEQEEAAVNEIGAILEAVTDEA